MAWGVPGVPGGDAAALFNKIRPVYATMAITQRDINDTSPNDFVVAAHPSGNDTLNPPSAPVVAGPGPFGGYYQVTGWLEVGITKEIIISGDAMELPSDGKYAAIVAWGSFRHTMNNSTVGFVLGVERSGFISFSPRPTSFAEPNGNEIANVAGGGTIDAMAGDKVTVWVASSNAGTINIGNANATVTMLEDTTP